MCIRDRHDLDLFHPWAVNSEQAAALALECETAAMQTSKKWITNSEGAAVSAQQSHFFSAHTHGFRGGYASSRHSLSVSPIAGKGDDMQRDAWYSSERNALDLASAQAVGRYAAERALSRLKSRKIATTECPVLFESPLASGLIGGLVQAISGGALYRKSSFLLDSLGKQVLPKHIDIAEDPFIKRGKGSSPFDEEGVKVQACQVVDAGRVGTERAGASLSACCWMKKAAISAAMANTKIALSSVLFMGLTSTRHYTNPPRSTP